jgi:hypothetical protein
MSVFNGAILKKHIQFTTTSPKIHFFVLIKQSNTFLWLKLVGIKTNKTNNNKPNFFSPKNTNCGSFSINFCFDVVLPKS